MTLHFSGWYEEKIKFLLVLLEHEAVVRRRLTRHTQHQAPGTYELLNQDEINEII